MPEDDNGTGTDDKRDQQQDPRVPPAGQQQGQQNAGDGNHHKRQAEIWKERADADKARADALATELDALKTKTMSDSEKAIAAAKAEGAKAATDELTAKYSKRLVTATARSVLAGRVDDPQADALLEVIDPSAFLKNGEPDEAAIKTWADRVAPARQRIADLGQGRGRGENASGADINALIRRGAGRAG
jgi:hypothetical protein